MSALWKLVNSREKHVIKSGRKPRQKMFEFMPPPKKVTYRDTKEYNIVEIQELFQIAESKSDH